MSVVITAQKKSPVSTPVSFVSYTYERCNLCSGTLVLEVDGVQYTFGYKGELRPFWATGGSCFMGDHEGVKKGRWMIYSTDMPAQIRKWSKEIDEVFNANVPWGCCGGCI